MANFAKVKGVLKYNEDTRAEMLERNYWKDEEYLQYGKDTLLTYHRMEDREVTPVTGGRSLLEYTQDRSTKYGTEITHQYYPSIDNIDEYKVLPYEERLHKWDGNYIDIFNDNNKLGLVGDSMYTQLMTFSQYANADRFLEDKYITPSLIGFYGGNLQIEGNNSYFSIFNRYGGVYKHESGRIPDIPEADVRIAEYGTTTAEKNNGSMYYLNKQLDNAANAIIPSRINLKNGEFFYQFDNYVPEVNSPGVAKTGNVISEAKKVIASNLVNTVNGNMMFEKTYDEKDVNNNDKYSYERDTELNQEENEFSRYANLNSLKSPKEGLLYKTNRLFNEHKISTLVGRFHTTSDNGYDNNERSITDTAKSIYGNSHGRNLLVLDANLRENELQTNGYHNPYCRVWTYHHQYDRVNKLIRPFSTTSENNESVITSVAEIQKMNRKVRSHNEGMLDGGTYLGVNSVLNSENGFVNITPSNDFHSEVDIKKCMFSIENLAWKDVPKKMGYLSNEQTGPNGGRIMWFPPYDLDFQESVNVDWDQNAFIGRGENVYTYKNTDRTGTLSFSLLIDHPSVLDTHRNNQGMGAEKNYDNDILRFFAGCMPLDEEEEPLKDEGDVVVDKDTKTDEPKLAPSEEKGEKIKFYVYYPNNYSGNKTPITEEKWQENGPSDIDWYKYLLMGKGTDYREEASLNGYEMKEESLDKADSPITVNEFISAAGPCYQWKDRKEILEGAGPFNYRVDFDLRQKLWDNTNYTDSKSFGINCTLNPNVSKGANYSFAEVMIALMTVEKGGKTDDGKYVSSDAKITQLRKWATKKGSTAEFNGARDEKIDHLIELFTSNKKLSSIVSTGGATTQDSKARSGCTETNDHMLARRRAKSIGTVVNNILNKDRKAEYKEKIETFVPLDNMGSVNSLEAKSQRFAVVEIVYNPPEVKAISDTDYNNSVSDEINEVIDDRMNPEEMDSIIEGQTDKVLADIQSQLDDDVAETVADATKLIMVRKMDAKSFEGVRYETEADYFSKLYINSPLVYNSLKEKFKYFSPAFHAISPEGFNARLTFLQQCTRQGHTIEASDTNGYADTAANLSFGRMPVCVLRIGDFINTRIIIRNISITYGSDGIQWDLNPEGAGVQPMYAKVSMGIVLIGGQSLSGPISRLQNAVSFEYYANAGVYDNRAAIADKDSVGNDVYHNVWVPMPKK